MTRHFHCKYRLLARSNSSSTALWRSCFWHILSASNSKWFLVLVKVITFLSGTLYSIRFNSSLYLNINLRLSFVGVFGLSTQKHITLIANQTRRLWTIFVFPFNFRCRATRNESRFTPVRICSNITWLPKLIGRAPLSKIGLLIWFGFASDFFYYQNVSLSLEILTKLYLIEIQFWYFLLFVERLHAVSAVTS